MNNQLSDLDYGEITDLQKDIFDAIIDVLDKHKVVILDEDKKLFYELIDDIKIDI